MAFLTKPLSVLLGATKAVVRQAVSISTLPIRIVRKSFGTSDQTGKQAKPSRFEAEAKTVVTEQSSTFALLHDDPKFPKRERDQTTGEDTLPLSPPSVPSPSKSIKTYPTQTTHHTPIVSASTPIVKQGQTQDSTKLINQPTVTPATDTVLKTQPIQTQTELDGQAQADGIPTKTSGVTDATDLTSKEEKFTRVVIEEGEVPQAGVKRCAHCGEHDPTKRCSQCKRVHFCNRDCQKAAWPLHKLECKAEDSTGGGGGGGGQAGSAASAEPHPRPAFLGPQPQTQALLHQANQIHAQNQSTKKEGQGGAAGSGAKQGGGAGGAGVAGQGSRGGSSSSDSDAEGDDEADADDIAQAQRHQRGQAQALMHRALQLYQGAQWRAAVSQLREVERLSKGLDDVPLLLEAHRMLGYSLEQLGDMTGARASFEAAVREASRSGEGTRGKGLQAGARIGLATNLRKQGRTTQAIKELERACSLAREAGACSHEAAALSNLGSMLVQDHPAKAKDLLTKAAHLRQTQVAAAAGSAEVREAKRAHAGTLTNLASLTLVQDGPQPASTLYHQALKLAKSSETPHMVAKILAQLSNVYENELTPVAEAGDKDTKRRDGQKEEGGNNTATEASGGSGVAVAAAVVFPTATGSEAGRWHPDGRGLGCHVPPSPAQSPHPLPTQHDTHVSGMGIGGVGETEGSRGVAGAGAVYRAELNALMQEVLGRSAPATCSICLDSLESEGDAANTTKKRTTVLECFHFFHTECWEPWQEKNHTCPECKHPVTVV